MKLRKMVSDVLLVAIAIAAVDVAFLAATARATPSLSLWYSYGECFKVDPIKNDWYALEPAFGNYIMYTNTFLPTINHGCELQNDGQPVGICLPAALDPAPSGDANAELEYPYLMYDVKCAKGRDDATLDVSSLFGTGSIKVLTSKAKHQILVPAVAWIP